MFRIPGLRRNHEFIHTGVKDYACKLCNKKFSKQDKLKVHMKRHLKIKDYVCTQCKKGFVESADLKRHKCMPSNKMCN